MEQRGPPASECTDRPKRRWFQYSLRTLLVFMVLVAIGLSWFAVGMPQAREQRSIVAAIRRLNGSVRFGESSAPRWLQQRLGRDFFERVDSVDFHGSPQAIDGLQLLEKLTQLRWLNLGGTPVTDEDLKHLEGLTQLRMLSLSGPRITDAGLEHLKRLTDLGWLGLSDTQVTDAGLDHLKGLTGLCELNLQGPRSRKGVCVNSSRLCQNASSASIEELRTWIEDASGIETMGAPLVGFPPRASEIGRSGRTDVGVQ